MTQKEMEISELTEAAGLTSLSYSMYIPNLPQYSYI